MLALKENCDSAKKFELQVHTKYKNEIPWEKKSIPLMVTFKNTAAADGLKKSKYSQCALKIKAFTVQYPLLSCPCKQFNT